MRGSNPPGRTMNEEELTNRLIGKDFGKSGKPRPRSFKSMITGNEYDYNEYSNHGQGGNYKGYRDLPKDEYPYTVIYNENSTMAR